MTDLSRRKFLTKASLGVAAGVAATAGLSQIAEAARVAKPMRSTKAAKSEATKAVELDMTPMGEHMIAHVRDVAKGEISVLVGSREVVIHDRKLVGRLLQGARQAEKGA